MRAPHHHGGKNRKYRFKKKQQKKAAERCFKEGGGLGSLLPKNALKAVRCQLREKDLVNWLTTSAVALGEAGPGALKRAILARDAQRKTDLVAEMAILQTIADDVLVSS